MQREMKFEAIKAKIKAILFGKADQAGGAAPTNRGWLDDNAFQALAYMTVNATSYLTVDRPALVAFAEQFKPDAQRPGAVDYLALYAKRAADRGFTLSDASNELSLIALRAREDAIKLIDRWDIREVAKLVDLFPDALPKTLHRAAIQCYEADNENADWMVSFDTSKIRPTSIH